MWVIISIFYIICSYSLMMVACVVEVLNYADNLMTFTWYIAIEVALVSTYVAVLMLLLIIKHAPCKKGGEDLNYNKIAAEGNSMSAAVDESLNASNGLLVDKKPLKKKDEVENPKKQKVTKYADTDEEEA
jgi:hypothetical protein